MDDNVQKNEGEVKQETAATESQPQQQDSLRHFDRYDNIDRGCGKHARVLGNGR